MEPYEPENVESIEFGFKTNWLSGNGIITRCSSTVLSLRLTMSKSRKTLFCQNARIYAVTLTLVQR